MAIDKITTPAVTDDSVTLAKMAPGTDGNIISYDASGNPVAVATGSAGQFLKSAGAGAVPSFATIPAGATATAEFSAYVSSDLTINDATSTALVFQTELFDPDSVYNTSNGRFTAPSDGKYFLSSSYWTYDAGAFIGGQNIMFYVNGSVKYRQEFISNSLRFQKFDSQLNVVLSLDSGDYVQVYAYVDTNDGGTLNIESSSGVYQNIFSGFRLPT